MASIQNISSGQGPSASSATSPFVEKPKSLGAGFGEILKNFVEEANESQKAAEQTAEDVLTGRTEHLHQAVIAINKAEMSFRYMMEVRSKLLQAYQEIQRMQL